MHKPFLKKTVSPHPRQSHDPLRQVDGPRHHEPLPEVGRVHQQQQPEGNIQEVRPVEDLETEGRGELDSIEQQFTSISPRI